MFSSASVGHADVVARALDDDFVGADAVHHVVDAVAALVQVRPRSSGRGTCWARRGSASRARWAACRARGRRRSRAASCPRCPSQNGQRPPLRPALRLALEVVGPLGPLVRDDHPAADDRIFSQLGHRRASSGSGVSVGSDRPSRVVQTCHMIRSKSGEGTVSSKIPSRGARSRLSRRRAARRRTGSGRRASARAGRRGRASSRIASGGDLDGRPVARRLARMVEVRRRAGAGRGSAPRSPTPAGSTKPIRSWLDLGQPLARAGPPRCRRGSAAARRRSRTRCTAAAPAPPASWSRARCRRRTAPR